MKTKIPTTFGFAIIAVVCGTLLALVFFFTNYNQRAFFQESVKSPTSSSQIEKEPPKKSNVPVLSDDRNFSISDEWLEITRENFWSREDLFANKENLPYHFPRIKFSYPSNWKFNCCSGMDHAEAHSAVPLNDKGENIKNPPRVSILTHVSNGCPDLGGQCAMNEQVLLTPSQKYQSLIRNLSEDTQILPKKRLKGINKDVFAYKYSRKEPPIPYENYIFIIDDEVVTVEFKNPEELGREFIEKFLQNIRLEE